jgi:hypothetical protein
MKIFKIKKSYLWLSGMAILLGLNSACSSGGSTSEEEQPVISACGGTTADSGLLSNGSFESGMASWTSADPNFVSENPKQDINGNSVLYANLQSVAENPWDVNIQQVLELSQGEFYKLSFKAMSNVNRNINAGIGLNEGTYTSDKEEVSLTTTCQTYEIELHALDFGGANSRVFFEMGAELGEVIIDDVSLVQFTRAPSTDTSAPTATDAISVYSDNYTNISTVNLDPGWGQSTVFSEETIDGGKVIKLQGLDYQGIEMDPNYAVSQDVSGKTTLRMDYWTAGSSSFKVSLVSPDGADADIDNEESSYNVTLKVGRWQSLEIPLSTYSDGGVDLSDVIQMKFEGNGTIYLDNIYFTSELTVPAPAPTETGVISVYSDNYTNISTVNLNPVWGQSTVFSEETIDGGKVIKLQGLNYQGIEMDPSYAVSQDVSGKTALHVDYWTADSTAFNVFLISTGPAQVAYSVPVTTGSWQSLEIPLSTYSDGGVDLSDVIQMKFDGDGTVYLDNIYFSSASTTPTAPTTSAPAPTETGVISVYSDNYTNISTVNLNPVWGQATVYSEVTIDGGKVIKLQGLNYQGIEMDPTYAVSQDVSGKTTLHLDYWTADSTLFRVFLVSPDGADADIDNEESSYNVILATGSWQSLEIPLSTYSGTVNLSDIIQMKFDGNGTIYLDNIYFY